MGCSQVRAIGSQMQVRSGGQEESSRQEKLRSRVCWGGGQRGCGASEVQELTGGAPLSSGTYLTHEAKGSDDAPDADTAIINAEGGQSGGDDKKEYFI